MDYGVMLGSDIKIRHLVLVVAIFEYGSLARASEGLFMTQPALSRALKEAETAVGGALFERTRQGMLATPAGKAYVEHARSILGEVETLRRRVRELNDPNSSSVSVGAFVTGANLLVPRAVAHLAEDHPNTIIRISEAPPETLIQELITGDLDLLVGRITPHPSTAQLKLVSLYREPYRIVAKQGHPALERHNKKLHRLAEFPWAMPIAGTPLYDSLIDEFNASGVPLPKRRLECATPAPLRTLLLESGYLAIMQESMVETEPQLQMHSLKISGLAQDVGYMLSPDRPLTRATELLIDYLTSEANRIGQQLASL
ncbi:LysR substrate-binding domain-containing protein [Glutamicibacter sp. NPDC087344]|uniref:LysR substrate-binding domain-containing protein n=1 Tax=Glutamicibacter sp. NPDC087344 TaxID=3363994 RepID=UPI0037F316C8